MRRSIILLVFMLCLFFINQAHAQRSLPGMRGIQLTGGMWMESIRPRTIMKRDIISVWQWRPMQERK